MKIQSSLAKAKGLGSVHDGARHWWLQRVTAIALVPLVIWFVWAVMQAGGNTNSIFMLLSSPIHSVLMLLFIVVGLYHGSLGMRVVIEDYVHNCCLKYGMLILLQFVGIILAVSAVVSVLLFHVHHMKVRGGDFHNRLPETIEYHSSLSLDVEYERF